MTIIRPASVLLATALLLAGCSAGSIATSEGAPAPDPAVETTPVAAAPGQEICELKPDFDRIDALLIKANRENPPAPSYRDAAWQVGAIIPPESIKTEWLRLRDLLNDYYPIIERGDSAELAEQADEVVEISNLHLTLFGYFSTLCS